MGGGKNGKKAKKQVFFRKIMTLTATEPHLALRHETTAKTHKLQGYDKCQNWDSGIMLTAEEREEDETGKECTEAFQLYW